MPTPKSKWQVTLDSATIAGPPPGNGPEADRGIAVFDPQAGFGVFYSLKCFLVNNAFNTDYNTVYAAAAFYTFNASYNVGASDTPMLWQAIFVPMGGGSLYEIVLTDSGASYLGGGTIAIEKDFDAGLINFITPAGTMAVPYDVVPGVAPGPGPWGDGPLEAGFWHTLYWGGIATSVSETNNWAQFQLFSDLSLVNGAALSAVDPGLWDPWDLIFAPQIPANDIQSTLAYHSEFTWTPPDNPFSARASEYRRWLGPTFFGSLDLTAEEHSNLAWGAWITRGATDSIMARRSDSGGHLWTLLPAFTTSDALASISIQVWSATVFVCFYDQTGTTTFLTQSGDIGLTWSTPMPITITGSHPRLVISHEGVFFFFSLSGTDIVLQRSFDFGGSLFDGSPISVAAGVPAQDFGAVMAPDKSVLVAYVDATMIWITRISHDLGLTWANA